LRSLAATLAAGLIVSIALTAPAARAMPLEGGLFRLSPTVGRPVTASPGGPVTVVAAGDIACDPRNTLFDQGLGSGQWCRAAAVEKVIQAADPHAVLALGDEQYEDGRLKAFEKSYALSWGQQLARTYAVPGNHEYYASPTANGYFSYFGAHAGPTRNGWYTALIGDWRLIALNSNCGMVGCAAGSRQYTWLHHLLVSRPTPCSVVIMHHPLVSSGPHGDDETHARPLWKLLYQYGVDLALVGHDHDYERFAPQDPSGHEDRIRGIREFVVGTGGAEQRPFVITRANSELRATGTFGIIRLDLHQASYEWRFIPTSGTFSDSGSTPCH
jgi:hypothetical protein